MGAGQGQPWQCLPPHYHLPAVEYPLQLLHSPPAPVVKRPGAVGAHHSLQVITTSAPPLSLSVTASSVPVSHHHCIPFVTMSLLSPYSLSYLLLPCPSVTTLPLPLSNVIASPLSLWPFYHCDPVSCHHVPSPHPLCYLSLCSHHHASLLSLCPSVTTFPVISPATMSLSHHAPSTTVQCHCIPSVTMFPLLWCPFYHCVLCHISFVTVSSVTMSLLPPHPDMSCYHVPSHHIPSPYSFCHVPCHCSPL